MLHPVNVEKRQNDFPQNYSALLGNGHLTCISFYTSCFIVVMAHGPWLKMGNVQLVVGHSL